LLPVLLSTLLPDIQTEVRLLRMCSSAMPAMAASSRLDGFVVVLAVAHHERLRR
jgi:hypothetical protein